MDLAPGSTGIPIEIPQEQLKNESVTFISTDLKLSLLYLECVSFTQ
jgi:hypothetical protein